MKQYSEEGTWYIKRNSGLYEVWEVWEDREIKQNSFKTFKEALKYARNMN